MNPLNKLIAAAAVFFISLTPAHALDKMTVLLDWFVNPDHGPLIIARDKGFFKQEGLNVELIAPADPNDPPKLVAAGKADIAVSYQPQLHLQVEAGLPLVRVGTLVATPLNSLVVLKDGPIKSIADLKGKQVGYSVGGFEEALLGGMLVKHGLTTADVELVNVNFSLSPSLISGQVDAVIGAFRNFELNQMDIVDRPGRAFYPEEEGVPAYDELIFVANKAAVDSASIPPFLRAIEQATQFIINHPKEAWTIFSKAGKDLNDELNRRAWRDTVARFALRPAALDKGRYERFAKFLMKQGLIKTIPALDTYALDVSAGQ